MNGIDLNASGVNPLVIYGESNGIEPHFSDNYVEHTKLTQNPRVEGAIIHFLKTGQRPNIVNYMPRKKSQTIPLFYYVTVVGIDFVQIKKDSGEKNTIINNSFASKIPGVEYSIIGNEVIEIITNANNSYTLTFNAKDHPFQIELLYGENNISPENITRFMDISLPVGTPIQLIIHSNGTIELYYDTDGDNIFESELEPTIQANSMEAKDIEAPSVKFNAIHHNNEVLVEISGVDNGVGLNIIYYSFDEDKYYEYTKPILFDHEQTPNIYVIAEDNLANRSFFVYPNLVIRGDIDGNNTINLQDAILGLRIVSGTTHHERIYIRSVTNLDGKIGTEEVLYILKKLSILNTKL